MARMNAFEAVRRLTPALIEQTTIHRWDNGGPRFMRLLLLPLNADEPGVEPHIVGVIGDWCDGPKGFWLNRVEEITPKTLENDRLSPGGKRVNEQMIEVIKGLIGE